MTTPGDLLHPPLYGAHLLPHVHYHTTPCRRPFPRIRMCLLLLLLAHPDKLQKSSEIEYVHTHKRTHTFKRMHAQAHTHAHTHTRTHTLTLSYTHTHTHTWVNSLEGSEEKRKGRRKTGARKTPKNLSRKIARFFVSKISPATGVREAFPASAIWRLEERVGTGAFEACLQGQHCRSGVLPVVALKASPPRSIKNW